MLILLTKQGANFWIPRTSFEFPYLGSQMDNQISGPWDLNSGLCSQILRNYFSEFYC
jgi:hypothetical protein